MDSLERAESRRAEALQTLRGWKWLEELRLRFDLAIEVIGTDLDYVFDPLLELHASAGLRASLNSVGPQALRDMLTGVIRSGKGRAVTAGDLRLRLCPLFIRSAATPVEMGVLALADPQADRRRPQPEESFERIDRQLDMTGRWLVPAIEANLAATFEQVGESRELERMAGSFDVVDALTQLRSEREIIALLMDAVALWYDADVYVYQQDLSGAFNLYGTLPASNTERAAARLLGHQIWGRGEVFSAESHGELDDLGWSPAIGHTLFLPISIDQSTEWLIAVAEAGDDPSIRQTLGVFGRVAGSLLTDLQHQIVERLGRKLASILLFSAAPADATARMALEAVAVESGASSVQFATFGVEEGQPRRELSLQWGGAETDVAPFVDAETTNLTARTIAVGVGAGSSLTAVLSLKKDTGVFGPIAQRLARAAASTIGIWLSGSLAGGHEFQVPEPGEYGVDLIKRLRNQVDRFGHVKVGGAVAVVLPQVPSPAGQAIDDAVELLEHHVRPSDVIGTVGAAGAGVLLAEANRDVASAVVGRLLRAARDKGLVAVRVGVAMFAAASESPESVLERALTNARRGSV